MEIKFRKACFNDVSDIVKLCNECFNEDTSLEFAEKVFKETENDDNQIYLVGEYDGMIIAHTKIGIIPTMFEGMESYAILNHVCVKPEYRRMKFGTKMLIECEKLCREKKCIQMKLWSKNFRIPAHACYKKYGFTTIDATFFEKNLN